MKKLLLIALFVAIPNLAHAQRAVRNFPITQPDGSGSQWMIYQQGWLQQQGNSPVYSQGGMLLVNGGQANNRNNAVKTDDKTGEFLLDETNVNGVMVSRRIFFDKDQPNIVRIVDVLRNAGANELKAEITLQTSTNYGVNMAQTIADPRKKDQNIGWVAQTGNGRCAMELFAAKGSKLAPNVQYQQGDNSVYGRMSLTIPGNKSIALVHFHGTFNSMDQGQAWITNLKESKVLASLPKDVRKIVANFGSTSNFIGDIEMLRGDTQDIVELRTGDQLKGALKDQSFKLQASFGEIELPSANVLGMMNVGQFRPRQLIVMNDGQIFGGKLMKETIEIQLSSGQSTQIPLSQINRLGVRKAANEPEEISSTGPTLQLRSGDRVSIDLPTTPIDVVTRYGKLAIDPNSIAGIQFQSEEHGVHDIYLTDGSKFAGLVSADAFSFKLTTGGKVVSFPTSSAFRLQLAAKSEERDESAATLKLVNGDLLVGTLDGELKIDTAFDTITINGPELRSMSHPKESPIDLTVSLWDQTTLTGQLQSATVTCKLVSGPVINVPPALIEVYSQPLPRPSATMVDKIKQIVTDLNNDDWKKRDQAEADLVQMGVAVIGVLKELRPSQSPESQQRIDSILKQLSKPAPAGAAAPKVGAAMPARIDW